MWVSGNCADVLTAQGQTGFLDALEGQVATMLDTGTKTLTGAAQYIVYNVVILPGKYYTSGSIKKSGGDTCAVSYATT